MLLTHNPLYAKTIDIDFLVQESLKENKHLFVWLHKTGCYYCYKMKDNTLKNNVVYKFTNKHFKSIHINVSENDIVKYQDFIGNGNDFAKEVGYAFYPASLFFDNDSDIIYADVGYVNNKDNPHINRFFKILNYIQSKSYDEISINEYSFEGDINIE